VENIRQHGPGDPRCFRRRIPAAVLQRVSKYGDETGVAGWLRSQIRGVLLTREEGSLIGPRSAIRLNPLAAGAVQRASPQADLSSTEG
jgi:hypothetical protein